MAQLLNIQGIDANNSSSYALRRDGKVISWGSNSDAQLSYSTSPLSYGVLPALILDIRDITMLTSEGYHSMALAGDGTAWGWGQNGSGQLGIGTLGADIAPPVQVKKSSTEIMTGIEAISTSYQRTYFLKEDGTLWGAGGNSNGELGTGQIYGGPCEGSSYCYPVQIKNSAAAGDFLHGVVLVSAGSTHTVVKKADGTVWAWGMNMAGEIGDGTLDRRYYPVQIRKKESEYLTGIADIRANGTGQNTFALLEDRTVWSWGSNGNYLLGIGLTDTLAKRAYPQQVEVETGGYLTDVIAISVGQRGAAALKADGTVWWWGNWYAGDGTSSYKARAVQVKTSATDLQNVIALASGGEHTLALKSDGSVWGWGANTSGQIGIGNRTSPQLYAVPVQMPGTLLSLVVPWMISPGQEGTFKIFYQNIFNDSLGETVIVVDIPKTFEYVSSTYDGIIWNDGIKHQVFWKLGTVESLQRGDLSVTIRVPAGTPETTHDTIAEIGARNLTSNFNLDDYLEYNPRKIVAEKDLTPSEISSILLSDPNLKNLYDYALDQGYEFHEVAAQNEFKEGDLTYLTTTLAFVDPVGKTPILLHRVNDLVFLEKYAGDAYTRFDQNGGYTVDLNLGTVNAWGTWSESHSLKFFHCLFNCFGQKFAAWAVKKLLGLGGAIGCGINCTKCMAYQDGVSCAKCATELLHLGGPLISPAIDFAKCLGDCLGDPDMHICTEDTYRCETNYTLTYWIGIGSDWSIRRVCDKTTGVFRPTEEETNCNIGQKCYDGHCRSLRDIEYNGTHTAGSTTVKNVPVYTSRNVNTLKAWDPNQKTVDYPGDVIPGQRLTYKIDYENTGKGNAYNVFILDELDPNLDESTLAIENGGSYSSANRLLEWEIGTVLPEGKGSVAFSINVKADAAHGTQILNVANIHFPSVPQITPTSPVVNIVKTTVADAQTVEATAGIPKAIILTGRDLYSRPLTYRLVSDPIYGTLTGTPPNLNYTPASDFSGQDELLFVVNNGTNDSDPARVIIKVLPNPSDKISPTVTATFPAANAIGVAAPNQPITTTPIVEYRPTITAKFSEPVKPETVNENTFTIDGLSGYVFYDEAVRTASFAPSSPLMPSTVYTAHLGAGVTDMVGNPLTGGYSWAFQTVSPAGISVTLPDHAATLDFGKISVNETSPGKTVNVTSTGNDPISITSISVAGNQDFKILEDQCTGKSLPYLDNCTISVAFAPSASGSAQGGLEIQSTNPNAPVTTIPLLGTGITTATDQDGDGYLSDVDCNVNDNTVHPGAPEVCDGKDNDCDSQIDEDVKNSYYRDADGDGYGNRGVSVQACSQPAGYVSNNLDCDDNNSETLPGAVEICDGKDNNCNGLIDEGVKNTYYRDADGDGYGNPSASVQACSQAAGYVTNNSDCDDTNPSINPTTVWYKDADNDGYSDGTTKTQCQKPDGYQLAKDLIATSGDCNDNDQAVNPGAQEVCGDGIDNNCNGQFDEGCVTSARISGGAYFYPESSTYRASFSMDVTGPSSPTGWLKYYYTRTRMNFVSTGITSVSVSGNTATISGNGTVNGVAGYTFTATVIDGSPDRFVITILKSGNTYYKVEPSRNIIGGNLVIQ